MRYDISCAIRYIFKQVCKKLDNKYKEILKGVAGKYMLENIFRPAIPLTLIFIIIIQGIKKNIIMPLFDCYINKPVILEVLRTLTV